MISMGSLGTAVMRLAAENAIESSEDNRLIIRAGGDRKKAAIETDLSNKEAAAGMQQAQGYYQIGMAVVGAAKSAKGAVDAGQGLANRIQTEGQIQSTTDAGRADVARTGEVDPARIREISNMQYEGVRLGDRFSDEQIEALVRGDFNEESLRAIGQDSPGREGNPNYGRFSEEEISQLMDMKRSGGSFTSGEAVEFLYDNRYTPEQRLANARQEALEKGGVAADGYKVVISVLGQAVNGVFDQSKHNVQDAGKKAKDDLNAAEEMRKELAGATFEHNQALGQIELQMIKGKAGAGQSGGKK